MKFGFSSFVVLGSLSLDSFCLCLEELSVSVKVHSGGRSRRNSCLKHVSCHSMFPTGCCSVVCEQSGLCPSPGTNQRVVISVLSGSYWLHLILYHQCSLLCISNCSLRVCVDVRYSLVLIQYLADMFYDH